MLIPAFQYFLDLDQPEGAERTAKLVPIVQLLWRAAGYNSSPFRWTAGVLAD